MTVNDMIPAVGQRIGVQFESIEVFCVVKNVKCSYGKPRLEIEPLSGVGRQWIELSRVRSVSRLGVHGGNMGQPVAIPTTK